MNSGKATIHDISKALNIDSSTVSRALNNSPRVSSKTKAKILTKAAELGYQRNSLASNLRTNKTNTIGVIVPRISRSFFSSVISGIEETAYKNGYNVIICQSLEDVNREKKIMDNLLSNRVDGVLISISMQTSSYEHLKPFRNHGAPIVFYDRPCNFEGCTSVSIDDFEASFKATEHLISNGCKNIVHFGGPQNIALYKNRKKGYLAALEKYGLEINEIFCFENELSENDGVIMAKEILKMKNVDGIYAANDTSAISALQYLKSKDVKIPEDIAIVGFNNDPISSVIEPSLTTINQPDFEMGRMATNALIDQIKDTSLSVRPIVLKSELIVRSSSKVMP
ncbi:LacI family transcriptional regulator [Hyunsoonleella flava]|uniref:LacI family transcriptional regulator n=1 Tax=Hyunsoonleella flava TaxID=2527939 RepID=A0A4V2JAD5_9FLAO|nr:LacI family DNA-binding transcriptional regulator [Hyunsoonleella flava]TBN05294.1 LacI family transcriptional regulator [Hyunsoonleella flava]